MKSKYFEVLSMKKNNNKITNTYFFNFYEFVLRPSVIVLAHSLSSTYFNLIFLDSN